MNTRILIATAAMTFAAAGAAPAVFAQAATKDTGSMAYPAPNPQGNVGTTSTVPRSSADTGNMAYPAPQPQGNLSTTPGAARPNDTGSMAYPAPVPQGNIVTTPAK